MKLLIDLQAAQTSSSVRGIGRFSLNLTKGIAAYCKNTDLWVALNALQEKSIENIKRELKDAKTSITQFYYQPKYTNHLKRISDLLVKYHYAQIQPDILHISSLLEDRIQAIVPETIFDMPLITSVTLYDLIPLIFQKQYFEKSNYEKKLYLEKIEGYKKFDMVLAISETSRQDAIFHLNLNPENVFNIYGAADKIFKQISITPDEKLNFYHQYNLKEKFILYTGGLDFRKNIFGLIKSYSQIPSSFRMNYQLVIVCACRPEKKKTFMNFAKKCGLAENEINMTGFVPDEDLVYFYNLCTLFIFPSLYEGLGLPILEAMSCGAPVIASNVSSMPELIDFEAACFDEKSPDAITKAMFQALSNDDFRRTLSEHGLKRAKIFTWEATSKLAYNAFQEMRQRHKKNRKPESKTLLREIAEVLALENYKEEQLTQIAQCAVLNAHLD